MNRDHISVAMCTYNGARFLPEQLRSIAAQTMLPDELVICDDGSSDETMAMVREFAERVPFPVHVEVNGTNLGTTKNFEKVIGLCRGEIIALADFDDVWKPHKLAVIDGVFETNRHAGYVFSNAELINREGATIELSMWSSGIFRGWRIADFTPANQVATLLGRSLVTGAAMAFRSELRNLVAPFTPHFVHDYWMSLVLSCMEFYGVAIPEPLISYRQHESQKTGVYRKSLIEKIRFARGAGRDEYNRRVLGYQDVQERLLKAASEGHPCPVAHLDLIEEMITHSRRRAAAHSARGLGRPRIVLAEAFTGRYRRFSNSWQSMIEDVSF